MAIQIQSFNQILGNMIRKILAETPLNDLNAGSVLLTLLEAAAANDFENNAAILNVLELLNIDAVKNNDLDARAGDYGLTRHAAIKASGYVTILNKNITKRSTGLYVIKPAPIAGQNVLFVNNTDHWATSGNLYIGRGTQSFEGPIAYTSITKFPTYSQINLASALQKDHLISDIVIDSQGEPDRIISAGTVVKIPANNQNPEVQYVTLRDAVIPSGEDKISNVTVIALVAGSLANAGINTIAAFDVPPFTGAGVTNTSAFSNGSDIETDVELRNRIKSYAITLARGTSAAIIAAVIGISDPDDNKQVASAVLTEPTSAGDPSILYIDDGSGFEPSFTGQSVDIMLSNATGKEEFLQLANYPLPRPQIVNVEAGPFTITNGSILRVIVDGTEETIQFTASNFLNISAATISEIIIAINNQSTLFKARFADNTTHILIYPVNHAAEIIQVAPKRATDSDALYINNLLKFPTNEFSYISLYRNADRLHEKGRSASLETSAYASWNISSTGDIIISVDGTPAQDRTFVLSDFPGASSFTALTLQQWVNAFNVKFAGLTAVATPSQTMIITSNKSGSQSSINVSGGTYLEKWFTTGILTSVGQTSDFKLNRQTGNLRVFKINTGDTISAGVEDAKGFAISTVTSSGNYNVSSDTQGRPAEMVVVADSKFCNQRAITLLIGATISITNPYNSVMRITSSTLAAFQTLLPGDFIYIAPRTSGWVNSANAGLYKMFAKGNHTIAGTDSFIDVENVGVVPQANVAILDSLDIKAFSTDGFPQIWRGSYVSNPPVATITDIVNSLNIDLLNIKASVYKSSSIKLTSTTEEGGSIAIPVAVSNASLLFTETQTAQLGNPPHIAHRVPSKDLVSYFRRTDPVSANIWLGRHVYGDVKRTLISDSAPDQAPYAGTYSEIVNANINNTTAQFDDYLSFTRGDNRGQFRTIKAFPSSGNVGTQQGTARTQLDHIAGDELQVVRPVQLSTDDSIVVIMDKDQSIKTVDIKMARTGRVNSGSSSGTFIPTTTEFSANDADNEPSIDFGNTTVWGTTVNNTDFSDYAVWMRARNWYFAGGVGSGQGSFLVRSKQYGPNGEKLRFAIGYPTNVNQAPTLTFVNTPSFSTQTYFFGSGAARPTAISAGDMISVSGPYPNTSTQFPNGTVSSGNYYDYTFASGNFATVQVGDVLSIFPSSGVSISNSGQFRVQAKSGNTVRVFNPNASLTAPGNPEITSVITIADIIGTPTAYTVTTVADIAGSLHQKYFTVYDSQGSVAVWYDVNNTGTPPPSAGTNRYIKVATVVTGDSAVNVATKTAQATALDNAFHTGIVGNQITLTNVINGPLAAGNSSTSGFTVATSTGTADQTINGKYFIIYDDAGSVAVWYDLGNGATPEPFHGANRSIKVSGANFGDAAATVAAATVAAVNPDTAFNASSISNVLTITSATDGNKPNSSAGTSGFTVSHTDGSLTTAELITNPNGLSIFPLTSNDVATIVSTVNASNVFILSAVGSSAATISKSTQEEDYAYAGNATALAYGHNPSNINTRAYISMYDGVAFNKSFENPNPNFTLKAALTLNGISSAYHMDTAPNSDTSDVGEYFKLIPTSVKNVYHHLTQKALSQLPIVANIAISNDRKRVQIDSKLLGSAGAIEVIGGNANKSQAYITSEAEDAVDGTGSYLLVKVPAFPDTFNDGDFVTIQNDAGVRRLSRLQAADSIDVTQPSAGVVEYNYNPKAINAISSTTFTIADVSGTYGRPAGYVWRWTHGGGATLAQVNAGDIVFAFGPTLPWAQGNKVQVSGDDQLAGFPIIAVNDGANYFDVVNPLGKAMTAPTAVGSGNTVQICPTPAIRWTLAHAARVPVVSTVGTGLVVTMITTGPHRLNTGDSISIIDSDHLADATYGPVTVINTTTFSFANSTAAFMETAVGASVLGSGLIPTRYRIEKLGFNNMIRLSRYDGQSPRFVDCGVAVDDYVVLGGSTFKANNNGRFRVVGVDNDSIIMINSQAADELNTTRNFNNKSIQATWTANTTFITGIAGTFKNLNIGDWVKKPEDPDTSYLQIVTMNASPASATQINLGGNYAGATAVAPGIAYDEFNDYDKGIHLLSVDDIIIYEGDSVVAGDTLSVQNIVNTSWFSINNIGTFEVSAFGTNGTTYKPFIRVPNVSGTPETSRSIAVAPAGFYVTESLVNKFYSVRQINHAVLDDLSTSRRSIYMTPDNRSYKFSNANNTSITHVGKLGYNTDITTGVDGYLYYTGLLRRVQRIVDGYEPDAVNYPGRRAVGGLVETLPPLVRRISISINVTTGNGVNLGDITNNIKSVIINYVQGLGVGQDVIISEIIAQVMNIKGISAVTFTNPVPSTERITIANNERASVVPSDIGIA